MRILFDRRNLYMGIYCYDSNPAGIVATDLRRDGAMEGDDIFEVMFDTFHDHRNGYRFRVNPLGTIRDQQVNNEGQVVNDNWDEKWDARARITEDGWVAEVVIPFKAVRFNSDGSTWGMNLHRTIMRKNEEVFWVAKRGYTLTRISGEGHLEGLSDIEGFRFRVKPYVTGSTLQSPSRAESTDYRGQVGVEDAKYMVTPQLALDLTVKPDFAQADVDQAQVNLSRFNLFFPERREFFQEGAGLFQFGTGSRFGGSTDFLLFHSRRIGLSDAREEIPIIAGLKVAGKQGPVDIGLLNMQTDRDGEHAGQNFSVLRLKTNILSTSSVGVMLTRNTGSPLGGANRTIGVDSHFIFLRYLSLQGFLAKSFSTGLDEKDWTGKGAIRWSSDRYLFGVERLQIDENFRPEMGFVRRAEPGWKGLEQTQIEVGYKPRPRRSAWIRQFNLSGALDSLANREGLLETREGQGSFSTELQSGDVFAVDFSRNFERLVRPFRIAGGGGTVPVGTYHFNEVGARYTAFVGRKIAGNLSFARGGYYDGTLSSVGVSPSFRLNPSLSFAPSFEWNRIARVGTTFVTRELNTTIDYSLNQKWLTRTALVWNSQDHNVLVNFRANYIFRPGDDLFLVYSESRAYGDVSGLINRAFIVKLTYSLDL